MKILFALLALFIAVPAIAAPQACRVVYLDTPAICHSPSIFKAAVEQLQRKYSRANWGDIVEAVDSLETNEGPYTDASLLAHDAALHLHR